jgi:2-iminobutanoate/2-iminopropanoate deaminase
VFTAGHLVEPTGVFRDDVEGVLDNLEATLEASGAGLDTLLMVNIYLADWNDWEVFNAIYVRRLVKHGLPPRATVQVARLGWDARIEISATAHVRASAP